MKKWLCVWLTAAVFIILCAAAAVFLRGRVCAAVIIAAALLWAAFLVRFCLLKYDISDSMIVVSGGLIFKYSKKIELSAIISKSLFCLGRHPVCTVVRTAGSTIILFGCLPEN